MANKVFDYYKDLPQWAKGVVVIGGIAIVYFTTKQIIDRIKEQATTKKQRESVTTQKNELKKLLNQGVKLSYPESQYRTWADQISSEFGGCDPLNSSYGKFVNILYKLKNDADFLALTTAYDIRTYDQCGIGSDFTGNLQQAVNDEFDNNEIVKINTELAKQKITYKF